MDHSIAMDPQGDPADARRVANISFIFFLAGGVVGLYNMATTVIPFGEGFEMVALANNLAHNGAFANPFRVLETGPTAANPPLYPLLLAIIVKIFKTPTLVSLAATICNVIANALTASLLPRISVLIYRDVRPGIIASVLWLLSSQLMPSWDTNYTVAALLLFCLLSSSGIEKENSIRCGVAAGSIAGALFLLNPSTIFIFLPWLAWIGFEHRTALRQTTQFCAVLLAVVLLLASAWAFRNHQQLGKFVVRTNLGMTLYASNNDCARSSLISEESNNCYQAHHPNTSLNEAELLMRIGEPGYDRLRIEDTERWIRTHPGPFMRLTMARVRDFWFPVAGGHPFKAATIWLPTLLAIPGLLLMAARRERVTWFVVVVLLIYPLMYYVVVSDVRYRLPVLWLSLLPAGLFLAHAVQRIFSRSHKLT
jgi:hypothetical protein